MNIDMRQVFKYAKFAAFIVVFLILYNVFMKHGSTVQGSTDDSMAPAVQPGHRVWYTKEKRKAAHMKRGDLIIFRHPNNPSKQFLVRVKAVPGNTVEGKVLPRGYLWVLLDNRRKEPDSRTFGPLHEHFIVGKVTKPKRAIGEKE